MVNKYTSPRVLFPGTINEALELAARENSPVFWSGGTAITDRPESHSTLINLPKAIISLRMINELTRTARSETGMEISSMVTLDRLASISRRILAPGIFETLTLIGSRPLRCRATLGGHIAEYFIKSKSDQSTCTHPSGYLVPLLQLLDASVEIRYLRERARRKPVSAVKRIPLTLLEGEEGLGSREIITKINIPAGGWNFVVVECLPSEDNSASPLLFQALAKVEKSVITDWRIAVMDGTGKILRNRETEAILSGHSLPLSEKDISSLENGIKGLTESWENRKKDQNTVLRLTHYFMRKVSEQY